MHLHRWILHAEQDERDQCDSGHPVSFKSISRRPNRIARVVACAIGNHARVAGIIFLNLEYNLHQIGADIGDLGENSTCNSQRRGSQRFANGKSNKARPGVITGHEKQDEQHNQQLDADQHHPNAHSGLKRNPIDRVRFASQAGKGSPRIRERVYPNAEPCHSVASGNAHHAEHENDDHAHGFILQQHAKIEQDDDRDERPQQEQEFPLRDQVGPAGFIDQFRNFTHGAMHWQIFQPRVNHHPESQAEKAEENPNQQQPMAIHSKKVDLGQVRKLQVCLAAGLRRRLGKSRGCHGRHANGASQGLGDSASSGRNTRQPDAHWDSSR